jgi:alkylated DNA repair dioxygenase AlkB
MPEWGVVLGLSLGAPVTMEFVKPTAGDPEVMPVELAPRSIYLQTGDARHVWQHSIPEVRETRWGITFRDLSDAGKRQRDELSRRRPAKQ